MCVCVPIHKSNNHQSARALIKFPHHAALAPFYTYINDDDDEYGSAVCAGDVSDQNRYRRSAPPCGGTRSGIACTSYTVH